MKAINPRQYGSKCTYHTINSTHIVITDEHSNQVINACKLFHDFLNILLNFFVIQVNLI